MADQDADRSELPTQHKLDKAREKGSVAKSNDVVTLVMLSAAAIALHALPQRMGSSLIRMSQGLLTVPLDRDWTPDAVCMWLRTAVQGVLDVLSPLFLILVVAAIVANMAQTGPMFSPQAMKPQASRINPVAGFKRLFSLRFAYEGLKNIVKLALLGVTACIAIGDAMQGVIGLGGRDPMVYGGVLLNLSQSLFVKLLAALALIVLVDLVFSRWEFLRQMHMSRREVKDEHKQREGDPRIRQKLRQLRVEFLRRVQSARNVPKADVLITNPTHIAVALRYESGSPGPRLLAKGAGELARKMRETAHRHHVPVVENRPLARALFREVDFEAFVPERWYPEIARILLWVYRQRETRAHQGSTS